MAIKYAIDEHAVAFPSKLLAQTYGAHILNVKLTDACDNGNLVGIGAFIDLDLYEEAAATTFEGKIQKQAANGNWYVEVVDPGDAYFVYMQPFTAEEWTNKFKAEKNFYNEAGDIVRAYQLCKHDVFEVSEKAFTGTPEAGSSVSVADKKLVVA